jgi:hypothetical protein
MLAHEELANGGGTGQSTILGNQLFLIQKARALYLHLDWIELHRMEHRIKLEFVSNRFVQWRSPVYKAFACAQRCRNSFFKRSLLSNILLLDFLTVASYEEETG